MPISLSIRVTQVRETVVTANSLSDAILIAQAEFNDDDVLSVDGVKLWGHVTEKVKETQIRADLL